MLNRLIALVCLLLVCCCGTPLAAQHVGWIRNQESLVDASFRGIAVRNAREAWVGGSNGTLICTRDAGQTWQRFQLPDAEELDFRDIALPLPQLVVVMAAGPAEKSRIYRSADGGTTWTVVLVNRDADGFFNALTFADTHHGWLVGDPIDGKLDLYRTRDAGQTWQRQPGPALLEGEYGFAASGTNIVALDRELRIATGGAAARVLRSFDDGQTWDALNTPIAHGNESSGIFSLDFRDPNHGLVVGGDYRQPDVDNGNVARTTDGGQTWSLASSAGQFPHKACVRFLKERTWMAAGRTGVAVSYDDGRTWQTVIQQGFFTFDFDPSSAVGWLAGSDGRVARFTLPPR